VERRATADLVILELVATQAALVSQATLVQLQASQDLLELDLLDPQGLQELALAATQVSQASAATLVDPVILVPTQVRRVILGSLAILACLVTLADLVIVERLAIPVSLVQLDQTAV
jgi:hypothetical protein